ncbi:hypothetical protein ASG52_11575 [Methylobacterium sp. Leaf456]|nr:hypothetical protein ASG52_11575 [Methylobacterium sp. Leaf456]
MIPILTLLRCCRAKRSLEGGLQGSRSWLEPSFEAASQHLRMRGSDRMKVVGRAPSDAFVECGALDCFGFASQ